MWWLLIPLLILMFLGLLLIRAWRFRPEPRSTPVVDVIEVDLDRAVRNLAGMIRCRTISWRQSDRTDTQEFERFKDLLADAYPLVHKACILEKIGPNGLLYHLKGANASEPTVFMSHFDVVPADDKAWDKPPFEGVVADATIWGRGALDTKSTLCAILEGAESLLSQGFVPAHDIYFAFSGDEEVAGPSAPAIVEVLSHRGIKPALVLDEGGAVVEGIFPGVTQPCAMVGIAEKGMLDVEFSLVGKGGHASAPPPHTSVGQLAQAVVDVENHPFRSQLTPAAAAMFNTLGRHATFVYRLIFANLWCFLPVLDRICRKTGGELNALMRTTCAFTKMEGSSAFNVLPPAAKVGANLRLAGYDTMDGAMSYLASIIKNKDIQIRKVYGNNASITSERQGQSWSKLNQAIAATWPDALISPYLMVACSDSRHYGSISSNVYRFSAMTLSREERASIHGNNERIPFDKLATTIRFYIRLMRRC